MAKLLIGSEGVNVNQNIGINGTSLHVAMIDRNRVIVAALLSHPDLNPNLLSMDGMTPLMWAAIKCDPWMAERLLRCRLHWRTSCPSDRRPDMSDGQSLTWMADRRGVCAPMSVPYRHDKARTQK